MGREAIELTCTLCKKLVETYSEIVYSQGSRVCTDCKKVTQRADDAQFDRDMRSRIYTTSECDAE